MRRALLVLLLAAGVAHANGRPEATSTIHFRPGNPQDVVAGMTFGVLLSHDGGTTWQWMCENAVGYGGMYDPDYAYTTSGALFATTFDGLKVMRDGCVFGAAPPGTTFVSQVEVAPDGRVVYTAADPHDAAIYQSSDDGVTFPISAAPGRNNDWWDSIVFATPERVYLAGYRYQSHCLGDALNRGAPCVSNTECLVVNENHPSVGMCGDATKSLLLMRSDDGAVSFTPERKDGLPAPTNNTVLSIVGVDPADPDIVYARMRDIPVDSLYVSTDGAVTWTKILEEPEALSFVVRHTGEIVVATKLSGSKRSIDHGATWIDLVNPPHIGCLVESPAGEVWACTQNYAQSMTKEYPAIPADGYGIMKSADLATWSGVLRYQDIAGAVACPTGTAERDQCVEQFEDHPSVWCCLAKQLGVTNPGADCAGRLACDASESAPPKVDGVTKAPPPPPGGCCDAGAIASIWLVVPVLMIVRRRRR